MPSHSGGMTISGSIITPRVSAACRVDAERKYRLRLPLIGVVTLKYLGSKFVRSNSLPTTLMLRPLTVRLLLLVCVRRARKRRRCRCSQSTEMMSCLVRDGSTPA